MSKFPGKEWENMLHRQHEIDHENYIKSLEGRVEIKPIAQYIGKAGWFTHIKDKDRYWERCLIEADGIMDELKEAGFKVVPNG